MWYYNIVDGVGRPLRKGDLVKVGERTGACVDFEEDYWPWMESGGLSGQLVIEIDEREVRLPTFSSGRSDVCYDAARLP